MIIYILQALCFLCLGMYLRAFFVDLSNKRVYDFLDSMKKELIILTDESKYRNEDILRLIETHKQSHLQISQLRLQLNTSIDKYEIAIIEFQKLIDRIENDRK